MKGVCEECGERYDPDDFLFGDFGYCSVECHFNAMEVDVKDLRSRVAAMEAVVEASRALVRRMDSPPFWPEPGEVDDLRSALLALEKAP